MSVLLIWVFNNAAHGYLSPGGVARQNAMITSPWCNAAAAPHLVACITSYPSCLQVTYNLPIMQQSVRVVLALSLDGISTQAALTWPPWLSPTHTLTHRSTGGNITLYNGNQLLAQFNACIQWAGQYGDSRSITVATTAPDPTPFNADMSAQAFLNHLQGVAVLPAAMLSQGKASLGGTCGTLRLPDCQPLEQPPVNPGVARLLLLQLCEVGRVI